MTNEAAPARAGTADPATEQTDKHFANVARAGVIGYLRSRGGDELVAQVLERAGLEWTAEDLLDDLYWSSYEEFRSMLEATSSVCGDLASVFEAGAYAYEGMTSPEYAELLQALGSPAGLLAVSDEVSSMFTTIVGIDASEVGPTEFRVLQRFLPPFEPFREYCAYYSGLLSISPRLFGYQPAEIVEEACQCDGAEACRFQMTWEEIDDFERRAESLEYLTKVLSARLTGLQRTVMELASSDDPDSMLAMIVASAARAVTAPAYVLALEALPAATRRVYTRGLADAAAEQVASRLLAAPADGGTSSDPAGMLVVDVASTQNHYGRLAAVDPRGTRQYLAEERPVLEAYASIAAAALDVAIALDDARRQANVAEAMTELLADERTLLSGIVEGLPHGVCWADGAGRLTGCNQALVDLLGYTEVDEVVGRDWSSLCRDQAASQVLAGWIGDVTGSGAPLINREVAIGAGDARRSVLVSVAPLRGHDGAGRVLSIWADVTEQRSMEQRLAETSRLESIGQLAAGVAHEINTPMQYIGDNGAFLNAGFERMATMVDELLEVAASYGADVTTLDTITSKAKLDVLRARMPRAAGAILDGVNEVSQIVRSLKTFSHPGGDDFEPVDLAQVLQSTFVVSRNEWKQVAEVDLDVPDTLPPIRAVPGMVNQVFLNLVLNASQAIGERHQLEGSGRLGRIAVASRLAGGWIETEVADDGKGIPESIRDKVYDQFFTTKPVGEGTGQGLAICRNIVTRHGGSIDFTTSAGGTTFTVRLPVWDEPVEARPGPPEPAPDRS